MLFSSGRKTFLASCWVIVLVPLISPPPESEFQMAPNIRLEVEAFMRPEGLVLYGDEGILQILRELIILCDLAVLRQINIVLSDCPCHRIYVYLHPACCISVRVDLRSMSYDICSVCSAGDTAYDPECDHYLDECKHPSRNASLLLYFYFIFFSE